MLFDDFPTASSSMKGNVSTAAYSLEVPVARTLFPEEMLGARKGCSLGQCFSNWCRTSDFSFFSFFPILCGWTLKKRDTCKTRFCFLLWMKHFFPSLGLSCRPYSQRLPQAPLVLCTPGTLNLSPHDLFLCYHLTSLSSPRKLQGPPFKNPATSQHLLSPHLEVLP